MAAKSKNKYDVFFWIKNEVIPSCTNEEQKRTVDNLIWQFDNVYNDYKLTRILMIEFL